MFMFYLTLLLEKVSELFPLNMKLDVFSCLLRQIVNRDFPSNISAAYAMTNGPQLKRSSCFWTGRNDNVSFPLVVYFKFWYSAFKLLTVIQPAWLFRLSQIRTRPLEQKERSHWLFPSCSNCMCSLLTAPNG